MRTPIRFTSSLLPCAAITLFLAAAGLAATDPEFLRAWERAQRDSPSSLEATATICGPGEPGERLIIHGRVIVDDGRAAVRDAIVFAWQTDASGVYDTSDAGAHSWRLRGWAKTDGTGRFVFTTIRPGAYPSRTEPEHVHFTVTRRKGARYFARDLNFADDPLIQRGRRRNGYVATVRRVDGVQHVDVELELEEESRF